MIITIRDIIHRPVSLNTRRFGHWILSPSSRGTDSGGHTEIETSSISVHQQVKVTT
jgi:hypothetical protein